MKRLFSSHVPFESVHVLLLLSRIMVGIMMLSHGIPKMEKLFSDDPKFSDPIGIGAYPSLLLTVFAEVACSVLLIVGLATRAAAFFIGFTMTVIIFIVHAPDPFKKKEIAILYLIFCIIYMITGAGKFSLDRMISKK